MALLIARRGLRVCAVLVAASVPYAQPLSPVVAAASQTIVSTHAVHAAFTMNLVPFFTWPEDAFPGPEAPLVIGTLPRDPINADLDAAARNEKPEGRPIKTIRIQSLDDVAKCHLVFLSKGIGGHNAVLERASGKPILTISDADGFMQLGGHVRFVAGTSTRLRISVENLKTSRLACRAQLLRIAAAP